MESLTRFPSHQERRTRVDADPGRRIMHVDMDAFFAAVEQADNPRLRGRPVVVGGTHGGRGVVTAASYEARTYGIHAGMPAAEAKRRCPHAIFVAVNARQIIDVSRRVKEIFSRFSPTVESVSVDEAFLDITGCAALHGGEVPLARRLKERIQSELSLTCSVGIAPSKIWAKLASSVFKPDGLTVVHPGDIVRLFHHLPVEKLWGVGPAAREKLSRLGIRTIGDLDGAALPRLRRVMGRSGEFLGRIARGQDSSGVVSEHERPREKSIGHETTFAQDLGDRDRLHAIVHRLSDQVARRMRRAGFVGRTITLKIRYADFTTFTRRTTLPLPTDAAAHLAAVAIAILEGNTQVERKLRLLGISVSHLTERGVASVAAQHELFPIEHAQPLVGSPTDEILDVLRDRFGERIIEVACTRSGERARSSANLNS